jgi:multidrug efflux pump subunit AcrA (membrane-fusion protein)
MQSPAVFLKKYRYLIVAAAFIAVTGALFLVWRAHAAKTAAPAAPDAKAAADRNADGADTYVQAFRVKRIAFKDVLRGLNGTVRGSSVELKSFQEERLLKYNFRPGDRLKKGDVIAELDHTRSQSRFKQAQIELDRKRKLMEVGGASKMELQ